MATTPLEDRQSALVTGGLIVAILTLLIWFGGLALLDWVTGQDVDTGLGPDFLYVVVLPILMAGLAWIAGRAAWQATREVDDDLAGFSREPGADQRTAVVAPFVALAVNWLVWNASLARYDWLGIYASDLFNPATLVVLIVFPLLLTGVTIWSGLAVQALLAPPRTVRRYRDESDLEPVDD